MPLYAYNLEKAIDKFWQVKEVTNLPISTCFFFLFPHGFCYMDPCSHMESIWNGQNILRKYLAKDIFGEPFVYQNYVTSN